MELDGQGNLCPSINIAVVQDELSMLMDHGYDFGTPFLPQCILNVLSSKYRFPRFIQGHLVFIGWDDSRNDSLSTCV